MPGDENASVMLETAGNLCRRLRDLASQEGGKGKRVERTDEPWDLMMRLGGTLKKSEALRSGVGVVEVVRR